MGLSHPGSFFAHRAIFMPQEAAHDFQAHAILSDVGMPAILPGLPDLWLAGNHIAAFQAATWRHFHLKSSFLFRLFRRSLSTPPGQFARWLRAFSALVYFPKNVNFAREYLYLNRTRPQKRGRRRLNPLRHTIMPQRQPPGRRCPFIPANATKPLFILLRSRGK